MLSHGRYTFSIEERALHPHMKLTDEPFPRLLSTRKVEDDDAEYFGPFLTRTGARILIDFLNTTFRLRTCTIPIDGSFPFPCTQYYAKRCVAPCVSALCSRDEYLDRVRLARLFLLDDRKELEMSLLALIDSAAERLEFEAAAQFRDMLLKAKAFWADPRRQVWLDDATDTIVVDREADILTVFVITTRRARTLGSWTFEFQMFDETDIRELIADLISQFYPVGGPREIRVPFDFPGRLDLGKELSRRFGRPTRIVVEGQVPERITALKALARTKLDLDLENLKPNVTPERIGRELAKKLNLEQPPKRIDAVDAAHISGTFSTAGMSVWKAGKLVGEEYREGLSERSSEIATLKEFVEERFRSAVEMPDLLLVDGGKAHVNGVMQVLDALSIENVSVVGAVKPPKKHGDVSHFLLTDGTRVDFDPSSPGMRVLKLLRDEAHDLANAAHRKSRDMAHFYELAEILPSLDERERQQLNSRAGSIARVLNADDKMLSDVLGSERAGLAREDLRLHAAGLSKDVRPLIVPIRYDDPNGAASDLRPINTSNRSRLMEEA